MASEPRQWHIGPSSPHAADVAAFNRDGFVVLRGVFSTAEVRGLRSALADCVKTAMAHGGSYPAGSGGGPVWQVVSPHVHVASVMTALRTPRLAATAAACLGATGLQLLQDVLLLKPAHVGGRIDWHQDHTYTGYFSPPNLLSIRIALGTENPKNGGLRVLQGSHRWPTTTEDSFGSTELAPDALAAVREAMGASLVADAERSVDLAAGDVSLHHCRTLHCSGDNESACDRLTVVAHAFDATATLVTDALPATLTHRFVTDDAGRLCAVAFPRLFPT